MNKLLLFSLAVASFFAFGEACGFGSLCGGLGGAPSAPACPPPVVSCPSAPLQNSCSSGGYGGCGGGGGGGGGGGCGGCRTRRRQFRRRHTRDAVHHITEFVNSTDDHPVCNNVQLHDIIEKHLSEDAEKTKDAIHDAVTKEMQGLNFAVFCSAHEFYFTSDNHMYCLHGNKIMTCYVFQSN
uniref:Ground-like domain-containing protein n=1 Tax=Plectus sambesii TaxID=2011161 RepID=A0A914UHU9_9BILA